jgi:hypothetical protein
VSSELAPVSAAEVAVGGLPDPDDLRFAIELAVERKDLRAAIGAAKWAEVVATAARLALDSTAEARPYAIEALRGRWGYAKVAGPNPGAGGDQKSNDARSFDHDGLAPKQRERWRHLYPLTEDDFERAVAAEAESWPSFKGLVSEASRLEIERERDLYDAAPTYEAPVRRGDFRDVLADIEPGSVSLVLTDPPYERIELYEELGRHAAEWLRPGGSLVAMCLVQMLPDVLNALGPHLQFCWVLAQEWTHGARVPGRPVVNNWKPLVWYTNGPRRPRRLIFDVLKGERSDRSQHRWAQSVEAVWPVIERLTMPGELIVDPFAGTAAWGRSALAMNRRWIGADIGGAVVA